MVLAEVAAMRQAMTPGNCYQLAEEVVATLEQARAAVAAYNTSGTRAASIKTHARAHALQMAVTPEITLLAVRRDTFALLDAALARLDALPSWDNPLLDPPNA
jgi:hypothetical protein